MKKMFWAASLAAVTLWSCGKESKEDETPKTNAQLIVGTWQSQTETETMSETPNGGPGKKVSSYKELKLTFGSDGKVTSFYDNEVEDNTPYVVSGNNLILDGEDTVAIKSISSTDLDLVIESEVEDGITYEYSIQFAKK